MIALASVSFTQTIEERRAAARAKAEEGIKYLMDIMAKAEAEAKAQRALLPQRPPPNPDEVKAAAEKQKYAFRRQIAPWLFDADGKPTAEGIAFFEDKNGRERAIAASKLPQIRPKINPKHLLHPPTIKQIKTSDNKTSTGADPLYLVNWYFVPLQNRTVFDLWLVNAPFNEWWEIYYASTLQPTAWNLVFIGPPDAVSENVQKFSVAVPGQPEQSYFQIFLNKDSDYDGVSDGYEVAILKTDPLNPDSDSTRDSDNNGQPDNLGLGGNGIADGDEDFDGDGLTTSYEIYLAVDPLSPQSTTDSDNYGLPDWLESIITPYTGDPDPAPQSDSDGDGLNNITEWVIGLDPSSPYDEIMDNYATLPYNQRVVLHHNFQFNSPKSFGPTQNSNPDDAYFDASFAGYFGTAAELIVLKDTDVNGNLSPGTDTFKWAVAYQNPPNLISAQNIPEPDPSDGSVEDSDILLQVTDTLSEVWQAAKVNEKLNTLSEPTLIHIQYRSFTRMWVRFRKIQLMMVAEELPQGILLRIRTMIGEIHTQATILRKTTLTISIKYPLTQNLAKMGRFVPVAGAIASVLSSYNTANELIPIWEQYLWDVWRHCDNNNDTALDLAVGLSQIVDNAFPAPVLTAFLWPIWWESLSNFDGYDSTCY